MKTVDDYLNLITSEHRDKPDFIRVVSGLVSLPVQIQTLLQSMKDTIFDLDHPPVGDQLDIIGKWVGVSRNVAIPIPGVFFTWDGAFDVGWEQGVWQSAINPTNITILPDDAYLTLIRARIASNHWDGTTEGAYVIWSLLFPNINLLIQDNQDMSIVFAIQGTLIDSLTLALLTGGYLPLKPEGVHINEYVVPVDTNPLFGWDVDSDFIQGWDTGSWGVGILPT